MRRLWIWVAILAAGCARPVAPSTPVVPAKPATALHRIFKYGGVGYQPLYNRDKKLKIAWVEAGVATSSAHGEDLHGGGFVNETFNAARIGFADGSVKEVTGLAVTFSLDGAFESAGGPGLR